MNKQMWFRGLLGITLLCLCLQGYFLGQADSKTAPIPIIDFEGTTPYNEFDYAGPKPEEVDYDTRLIDNDSRFIKQGAKSRVLKWNIKAHQYFGWGVALEHAGEEFDTGKAKYLSFWVIGAEGGERFQIKIKDVNGKEVAVKSHSYIKVTKKWQKVSVPLKDFGKKIDLSRLENVNLGFNRTVSGASGCIYIDDFKFEF